MYLVHKIKMVIKFLGWQKKKKIKRTSMVEKPHQLNDVLGIVGQFYLSFSVPNYSCDLCQITNHAPQNGYEKPNQTIPINVV